jgi:hypothetical protein
MNGTSGVFCPCTGFPGPPDRALAARFGTSTGTSCRLCHRDLHHPGRPPGSAAGVRPFALAASLSGSLHSPLTLDTFPERPSR